MHEYNLEEYGLTVDQINTTFADYIKEYKLKEWYILKKSKI